ncbi:MAG: hypothetical protein J6L47_01725, partial [Alphaproteobacteria bacterium]|nr:hypothetical protein [Alphaproteobacteria bacterium]
MRRATLNIRGQMFVLKTKNRKIHILRKFWLGAACSYRHENPTEFTAITRLCEIFLKDYTNA